MSEVEYGLMLATLDLGPDSEPLAEDPRVLLYLCLHPERRSAIERLDRLLRASRR